MSDPRHDLPPGDQPAGTDPTTAPASPADASTAPVDTAPVDAAPVDAAPAEPDLATRLAEAEDRWRRALAEIDNLRKIKDRDVEEARKLGITRFARDLLDVADNLGRALQAVPESAKDGNLELKNLLLGVEMTQRALLSVFERHQIRTVRPALGERFDPARHQAMFEVETAGQEPGTVAEIVQDGYVVADRLLRPALVGVAKAPADAEPPQGRVDARV